MLEEEEKQARIKAEQVLSKYRFYKRREKAQPTLASPVSDGMPTGSISGNREENKRVKWIDDPARRYRQKCDSLLLKIEDNDGPEYAKVLRARYIGQKQTKQQTCLEIGVSYPTLTKLVSEALTIFGEYHDIDSFEQIETEYNELMYKDKQF